MFFIMMDDDIMASGFTTYQDAYACVKTYLPENWNGEKIIRPSKRPRICEVITEYGNSPKRKS